MNLALYLATAATIGWIIWYIWGLHSIIMDGIEYPIYIKKSSGYYGLKARYSYFIGNKSASYPLIVCSVGSVTIFVLTYFLTTGIVEVITSL